MPPTGGASAESPDRGRAEFGPPSNLETNWVTVVESPSPHPVAQRRAELGAELHRVGRLLDDPDLTPRRRERVITAYEQALRRVFALDEEAGLD